MGPSPIPAKGFPSPIAEKGKQTLRFCKWTSLEIVLRSCFAKCFIKNCFLSISCQKMSPPKYIFPISSHMSEIFFFSKNK